MLGFLSPEAEFYECRFFEHISLADRILKEKYNIEDNLSVEELCSRGWIVIQSSFVGFTGTNIKKTTVITFSPKQEKWLYDHYDDFTYDQKIGLNLSLDINEMYKEDIELGNLKT